MDTGHASCQFNSAWMHDDNDDDDKTGERDGRNENEEAEKRNTRECGERNGCRATRTIIYEPPAQ